MFPHIDFIFFVSYVTVCYHSYNYHRFRSTTLKNEYYFNAKRIQFTLDYNPIFVTLNMIFLLAINYVNELIA